MGSTFEMDSSNGAEFVLRRMQMSLKKTDQIMSSLSVSRGIAISSFFTIKFNFSAISNPIWDPKTYELQGNGKKVEYLTPEAALFLTHRAIKKLKTGAPPIPYDPRDSLIKLSELKPLSKVIPHAISYVLDLAFLRKIRKGIVWETITETKSVRLKTIHTEDKILIKSQLSIPDELERSIECYERRKKTNYPNTFWSSEMSSRDIQSFVRLFMVHRKEIEKYYGYPFIAIFAFFYAMMNFCEHLNNLSLMLDKIGVLYTKRALLDRLVVKRLSGKTGFEEGVDKFESVFGRINRTQKEILLLTQENICFDVLKKHSVSFRHLPPIEEFMIPLSPIIETQEDMYLLMHRFFNQIGGLLFEKPLASKGKWLGYRGKSFEDFCHETVRQRYQLTTFRKKIKDEFGRYAGDIDLGILTPPFLILCDCKDYRVNIGFIIGKERAVLDRIIDEKHGYLSWLSKLDKICSMLERNFVYDLISKNGSNPKLFKYIIPIVVTWRPEFILDTSTNMLKEDIPRVCTLVELCKILEKIPDDLPNRLFTIRL